MKDALKTAAWVVALVTLGTLGGQQEAGANYPAVTYLESFQHSALVYVPIGLVLGWYGRRKKRTE